jgi:glycosyltransferase involved in cell wall biosynthesis
MNVLIWSQYFWPEHFPINLIAEELANIAGVTVVTGMPNYPDGSIYDGYGGMRVIREKWRHVQVLRLPLFPRGSGSGVRLSLNYISFVASGMFFLPALARGKRYDVVFVYAPSPLLQAIPAILLARLKGVPLVLWVQDLWPEALLETGFVRNKFVLRAVGCLVRFIYRQANTILIQSEGFRTSVIAHGADATKVRYFPNLARALNMEQPPARTTSSWLMHMENHFSILFAGNIGRAQSLETIVEAADRLRNVERLRFFLVGTGSDIDRIRLMVRDKGLQNVILTGRIEPEEMPHIYNRADALVLTLKSGDGLGATIPSKLQTYFAAGKPIIASIDGEAARLVEASGAGVSCSAEDPAALAQAIQAMLKLSQVELAEMGARSKTFFEVHFDVEKRIGALADILRGKR